MFGLDKETKKKIDFIYEGTKEVYACMNVLRMLNEYFNKIEEMGNKVDLLFDYFKKIDLSHSKFIVDKFENCLNAARQHEMAFDQRFRQMEQKMASLQGILNELHGLAQLVNMMRTQVIPTSHVNELKILEKRMISIERTLLSMNKTKKKIVLKRRKKSKAIEATPPKEDQEKPKRGRGRPKVVKKIEEETSEK